VSYDIGEGVSQDKIEAVKWYRLAAEQGNAEAQYYLGVSYDIGEGVSQDKIEAVKWYRLAAEQGHAEAQDMLSQ
jgi:TPR repeat protein